MRALLVLFLAGVLLAAPNTKEQIKSKEQSIQNNSELEKKLNKKLDELAKDIIQGEDDVKQTATKIANLALQVKELEAHAKSANAQLNTLVNQNQDLIKEQKKIEDGMLQIISKRFAYDLVVPKNYAESEESIIANEVLKTLTKSSQNEVNKLAKDYSKTINLIKNQNDKIGAIKFDLAEFKGKQDRLIAMQEKQRKDLAQLKSDKENYQKQLENLQAQQKELRATLEKLAIVQKQEESAKAEQNKAQSTANTATAKQAGSVRQVGSSYQQSSVKRYTGAKTIAPLDSFTLKQAFGDYTDPIYKIKIFNESVVLRSNSADATVKNVLDGKVVFAKDTPLLEKVIILENANGMHTIYAHLSKIAPTVKVGAKIKKGYIIGRVARDLTFEVTQQNYHINPMELIASK